MEAASALTQLLLVLWAARCHSAWVADELINVAGGAPVVLSAGLKAHPEIVQWGYRRLAGGHTLTVCEKLGNRSAGCGQYAGLLQLTSGFDLRIAVSGLASAGFYRAVVWYIWDETTRRVTELRVYERVANASIVATPSAGGASCRLACLVSAGSRPSYTWTVGGRRLTAAQAVNATADGSRVIVEVAALPPADKYHYACSVHNPVSTACARAELNADCTTGSKDVHYPTWAVVLSAFFGLLLAIIMFLCASFLCCRDLSWCLRGCRAWFNPLMSHYPVPSSTMIPRVPNEESTGTLMTEPGGLDLETA